MISGFLVSDRLLTQVGAGVTLHGDGQQEELEQHRAAGNGAAGRLVGSHLVCPVLQCRPWSPQYGTRYINVRSDRWSVVVTSQCSSERVVSSFFPPLEGSGGSEEGGGTEYHWQRYL